MRNSIIITALLFGCLCFSQVKEDKLDSTIIANKSELNAKKVFDIFCISRSCWETGIIETVDQKNSNSLKTELFERNNFTAYIFWKENSKIYLQKFDYVNKYKPIEIEDFGLFEIIQDNLKKIKDEKVLEYQIRKGFKKVNLSSSPACQSKLYFYKDNDLLLKEFNEDDLIKTEYSDGRNKNLNYKSNNKLKMIEIFNLCESKIEEVKK